VQVSVAPAAGVPQVQPLAVRLRLVQPEGTPTCKVTVPLVGDPPVFWEAMVIDPADPATSGLGELDTVTVKSGPVDTEAV
jgi:hypothetical protein